MKITTMLAVLAVASCTAAQTTAIDSAVTTALAAAQADASKAISFYQTAKGIAEVAALADPTLAGTINAGIAVLDPLMATAQTALNSATTDAPTLEALATQIQSQAVALEQTAAPAIKVVSNKS